MERRIESLVNKDLLSRFTNIQGSTLMNNAFNTCTIENHLSVASVLFPEIVEVDGCIFISEFYNGNYDSLKKQFNGERKEIEKFVNSWSIGDFFLLARDESLNDDTIFDEFSNLLKYCWSKWLKQHFPEKNIIVELGDSIAGESGLTITVYQE